MASNKNPQFIRHVFQQQSNGAGAERVQRFGGQDKTALPRGHAATPQPEPHANAARSQALDTKTTRTKKHGSSRRKTVHLVLWVNPIVKGPRSLLRQLSSGFFSRMMKRSPTTKWQSFAQYRDYSAKHDLAASRETHTPTGHVTSRRLSPSRRISKAAA
jgi:hypothetical protein